MSNLLKLAIPLLNDKLTLEDIQETSGFVDAFFYDINRPSLTDHIFLMYDNHSGGENIINRFYKLEGLNNRYSTRTVYIKGKSYTVYTFTTNGVIRLLRQGAIALNPEQKKRILSFWGAKDGWVLNNVLLGTIYEEPDESQLPEEDYSPDFYETEKGVVLMQHHPFVFYIKYNNTTDR